MKASFCQKDEYRVVRSSLSARTLYVNCSDENILIAPALHVGSVRDAVDEFLDYNEHNVRPSSRLGGALLKRAAAIRDVDSSDALLATLNELLSLASNMFDSRKAENVRHGEATKGKGRIDDLLFWLWSHDCIAWPTKGHVICRTPHKNDGFWTTARAKRVIDGVIEPFMRLESAHSAANQPNSRNSTNLTRTRRLNELLLSTIGVSDIGDLTPEVVGDRLFRPSALRNRQSAATADHLARLINASYPDVKISASDYHPGRKAPKSDETFRWAVLRDPTLESWRSTVEDFMRNRRRSFSTFLSMFNSFFETLIVHPNLPRNPLDWILPATAPPVIPASFMGDLSKVNHRNQTQLREFFEYLLDTHCVAEGDDGLPYRIPGYRNPIAAPDARSKPYETVRAAMPTRFIRMLLEIIEENNYAWPRTLSADYFNWYDSDHGGWKRIWSPVRANAIAVKLRIPLRTFQVRVLNSGESDPQKYDALQSTWIRNTHPLAAPLGARSRGVLTRVWDRESKSDFVGLYINTNKTHDINVSNEDRGYTIPWQNNAVIAIACELRDWQEKYNPLVREVQWSEIRERAIAKRYHADVLAVRGGETFLFRDPASRTPLEPVTQARLQLFWLALCDELERRLRKLGETGPDGQPITLVNRGETGRPYTCSFDLHSLRVSLITAWAEQGVPIEYLMKVAGHCTAIMTIYYHKCSIGHVTEVLNSADRTRIESEQQDWERFLKSKQYDELEGLVAANDVAAFSLLGSVPSASWIRSDIGICPVGGNRCNEGGELLSKAGDTTRYCPVPGGARNCVRCRFFITGPPFLIPLHAHFNSITLRYKEASRLHMAAERTFLVFDEQRKQCELNSEPFKDAKKWQVASANFDQRMREVDDLAMTWHAAYRLVMDSLAILRSDNFKASDTQFALVTNRPTSEIDVVLEVDEYGEREFELLDAVCQSAVWFESIDPGIANGRRMRRFDAFLQRHGEAAVFCDMDEQDALRAGNELAKFMYTQFRREDVNALMAGTRTLEALGIEARAKVLSAARQVRIKQAARKTLPSGKAGTESA